MKDFSYISNQHPAYIESLYNDFSKDPNSIDPELKKFFEGFDFAVSTGKPSTNGGPTNGASKNGNGAAATVSANVDPASIDWMYEIRAYRMILGYRNKGHLLAKTNPIRSRKDRGANVNLAFYGFTEADLGKTFHAGNLLGLGTTTLQNIFNHL